MLTINSLIERTHIIQSSINEVSRDSEEIINSMDELKNISHDFTEQTEIHYRGSKEILNYLESEKHSIMLIENIMENFSKLITKFKIQKSEDIYSEDDTIEVEVQEYEEEEESIDEIIHETEDDEEESPDEIIHDAEDEEESIDEIIHDIEDQDDETDNNQEHIENNNEIDNFPGDSIPE